MQVFHSKLEHLELELRSLCEQAVGFKHSMYLHAVVQGHHSWKSLCLIFYGLVPSLGNGYQIDLNHIMRAYPSMQTSQDSLIINARL